MNDCYCPFCEAKVPTRTSTHGNALELKFKPSRNRSARQLKKLMKKGKFHEVTHVVMRLHPSVVDRLMNVKPLTLKTPESVDGSFLDILASQKDET